MQYLVQTVGDDELPEGMSSVIVERDDGPPILLINGERAKCWRFMRAWEDSAEEADVPSVLRVAV